MNDRFIYRNTLIRTLVNFLVTDVMEAALGRIDAFMHLTGRAGTFDTLLVWFSDRVNPLQEELDRFIASEIIRIASEERSDDQAREIIRSLFKGYYLDPGLLPEYRLASVREDTTFLRAISDHIAGMTDNYAELENRRISGVRHER